MTRRPQQLQLKLNQLPQSRKRKPQLAVRPVQLELVQLWRGKTAGKEAKEATPGWPRPTVQVVQVIKVSRCQTRGQQPVSGNLRPPPPVSQTITSGQKGQSPR